MLTQEDQGGQGAWLSRPGRTQAAWLIHPAEHIVAADSLTLQTQTLAPPYPPAAPPTPPCSSPTFIVN